MNNLKKIAILISSVFLISSANAADFGFNIGGSITAGVFEVDGAKETFTGTHSGVGGSTLSKNASAEGDEAKKLYALGSIFTELTINDKFALGIDYVPHAIETNQVENKQSVGSAAPTLTNRAEVNIEDITTIYASYYLTENFYAKAGYLKADVLTKEVLDTGGAYPNTDLDGLVLGLGYEKDLASGLFVRLEASYTDIGGITVTNTNDSTKSVSVDGITGYGALVSIGKSF